MITDWLFELGRGRLECIYELQGDEPAYRSRDGETYSDGSAAEKPLSNSEQDTE